MLSEILLNLSRVSKTFGDVEALSGVDLQVNRGQVLGLVGGNGAGKTTLLRLMSGVYAPTSGEVNFSDGKQVMLERGRLGVVPESTGLYHRLTAWENIRYHTRLHGIKDENAWARVIGFAKALDIVDDLNRHTKGFSRGMRQKTALLRALAHGPEVLLLDEPTAGLDVTSARTVRALVEKLRQEGGTIIYSTHQLAEASQVCDRIVVIHNGTIRADGSPEELMDVTDTESLEEAYVTLTSEKSRTRSEDDLKEGKMASWWRRLLTPKQGGLEDE